jgi:hypothetical protein
MLPFRCLLQVGGLLSLASLSVSLPADDFESVIRFNTTCAQCHEGQCSGRLSFSLGAEAAFDHIRRYAGDVDDTTVQTLYDALSRMKTTCSFAPLPVLSMREPVKSSELDRVHAGLSEQAVREPERGP